jgi:hydrogenase expression/formation protein HypE
MSELKHRSPFPRKLDLQRGRIDLTHGGGGKAMAQLIDEIFVRAFDSPPLNRGNDQAVLARPDGRLAVSTDTYVVSPLFFPGGSIGSLAVNGTINDVAMSGASPLYLSAGFVIEEGFPLASLGKIADDMASAAKAADVLVVTGDTKVVERGKGDGVFINTTGIGVVPEGVPPSGDRARPGDVILVSGPIGDHGVAILSKRENLGFETAIESDTAALHGLVADLVAAVPDIHVLRDPTRGGLAAILNEICHQSGVGMMLDEASIPIRPPVAAACELLGIEPFNVANEGRMIAICAADDGARLVSAMQAHPLGRDGAEIGRVVEDSRRFVQLRTSFGGTRIMDWLTGEQLPRIC